MPWIKDILHLHSMRREMFDYGPTGWVKTSCRKGSFIARPHSTVFKAAYNEDVPLNEVSVLLSHVLMFSTSLSMPVQRQDNSLFH